MTADEYMSPADIAAMLNVPLDTVRKWRHAGDYPPAVRVGKHIRSRRVDVDAWLASKAA